MRHAVTSLPGDSPEESGTAEMDGRKQSVPRQGKTRQCPKQANEHMASAKRVMQGIDPAASIQHVVQKEAASPNYKAPHADLNTIANLSPSASGQYSTLHGCLQNSCDC